ncbi:MAG: SH3 domain-containing protein, partial [Chloroflexota bacterium]|nr:SH3 domain-containing protein [Chloroflexota bacterium]
MKIPIALVLAVLIVSPILVHAQDTATPDPTILLSPTATARLALTPTPIGNWVQGDPVGIIVRSGPGLRFDVLGTLANGQTIEAVGRDAELGWIMIRLGGSFGWVRRPLVYWADNLSNLPVLRIGALTPSPTFTRTTRPTGTMTPTFTLTSTPIPTLTASSTPTFAPTST